MDYSQLFADFSSAYFFSACLQANASIIALIGVFWIFRIQSINSNIDSIKIALSMERGITSDLKLEPDIITIFELKDTDERKNYIEKQVENESAKSLLKSWLEKDVNKTDIMNSIKTPIIIIAIGLVIDAVCLVFSNFIHSLCIMVELSIISVALLYQILIIFKVVKNVIDTFKVGDKTNKKKPNESASHLTPNK